VSAVVWIDIFRGFLTICGLAVGLFVVIQLWRAVFQTRREMGPIPPENRRVAIWTLAVLGAFAALIFGAYRLGSNEWGTRTGAALAIGAFVIAVAGFFAWTIALGRRDARRDRERSGS
jgi:Na+/proline symporter